MGILGHKGPWGRGGNAAILPRGSPLATRAESCTVTHLPAIQALGGGPELSHYTSPMKPGSGITEVFRKSAQHLGLPGGTLPSWTGALDTGIFLRDQNTQATIWGCRSPAKGYLLCPQHLICLPPQAHTSATQTLARPLPVLPLCLQCASWPSPCHPPRLICSLALRGNCWFSLLPLAWNWVLLKGWAESWLLGATPGLS